MNFSQAEAQLLATLFALETQDWEWRNGRRQGVTRQRLREHGEQFFDDVLEPWDVAFASLRHRGLLREADGAPELTAAGRPLAAELRRSLRQRRLAEVLRQAEHSTTYETFCRRTGDLSFRAFSPLDEGQFAALLGALDLAPGRRLLDAGCGTGHVTQEIARRTGCRATGIDLLPEAVEIARRRTKADEGLCFLMRDLSKNLEEPGAGPRARDFDAVIAVDSLGFLDDLPTPRGLSPVLQRLIRHLRPGGVMILLGLESEGASGREALPTASALAGLGLAFTEVDLTRLCLETLRARQFAAQALGERFRREGHRLLGRSLIQEAQRLAPLLESGTLRRILYRVGPLAPEEDSNAEEDPDASRPAGKGLA